MYLNSPNSTGELVGIVASLIQVCIMTLICINSPNSTGELMGIVACLIQVYIVTLISLQTLQTVQVS